MRKPIRTAVLAGVLGLVGAVSSVAVTQTSAAAAPTSSGCCVRYGFGPWFSGPTQVADCQAYGASHLSSFWDGYHCTPGTGTHAGQTEVVFYLIIS
jgi:hypothetical protein